MSISFALLRWFGWIAMSFVLLPAVMAMSALAQPQDGKSQEGKTAASKPGWRTSIGKSAVSPAVTTAAVASAIELTGDARRTRIKLLVDRSIVANIFTLGEPYRTIIDIADLEFRLPATAGNKGHGVVTGYRYGQLEPGRSRVVIDSASPVRIENAAFEPPSGQTPGRLTFEVVQISVDEFGALTRASTGTAPAPQLRPGTRDDEPPITDSPGKRGARARPVIVIDAGHGGIDPGTVAASHMTEKVVVLAVASQVEALLKQGRRFDVHMTRQADVFVSLDQRLRISRRHVADLFISIHADSLAEKDWAQNIRGATVYTLSERASDAAAHQLAEKENAADVLAGMDVVPASDEDQVRNILIDLVRRETANYAVEFRGQLLGALKGKAPLSRDPQREAAFKVLKQPETPAVLIELGYMSNAEDLARLTRPDWQRQVAAAIVAAVEHHFQQRTAKAHP